MERISKKMILFLSFLIGLVFTFYLFSNFRKENQSFQREGLKISRNDQVVLSENKDKKVTHESLYVVIEGSSESLKDINANSDRQAPKLSETKVQRRTLLNDTPGLDIKGIPEYYRQSALVATGYLKLECSSEKDNGFFRIADIYKIKDQMILEEDIYIVGLCDPAYPPYKKLYSDSEEKFLFFINKTKDGTYRLAHPIWSTYYLDDEGFVLKQGKRFLGLDERGYPNRLIDPNTKQYKLTDFILLLEERI